MTDEVLAKNQMYAVQLNGLHVGLKASFKGTTQVYDPNKGGRYWGGYDRKAKTIKGKPIHKIIQTGKSVSILFKNGAYESPTTVNVPLNEVITLEID